MNEELLDRHLAGMRAYRLPAILKMIKTIFRNEPIGPEYLVGLRMVYLKSGEDDVIDRDAAEETIARQFPGAQVYDVPEGHHVDLVENHTSWQRYITLAYEVLDINPENHVFF